MYKVSSVIIKLKTPGGCSRQAITKAVRSEFGEIAPNALKAAIKKGTDTNILVQEGQRWWVKGHEPPPPDASETVGIEDIKVGTGTEASSGSQCIYQFTSGCTPTNKYKRGFHHQQRSISVVYQLFAR